jgi:hypothetical protein
MSLISGENLIRELHKIEDVLHRVDEHLSHKDMMNAALHMSDNVHQTPLSAAVKGAVRAIDDLVQEIKTK